MFRNRIFKYTRPAPYADAPYTPGGNVLKSVRIIGTESELFNKGTGECIAYIDSCGRIERVDYIDQLPNADKYMIFIEAFKEGNAYYGTCRSPWRVFMGPEHINEKFIINIILN